MLVSSLPPTSKLPSPKQVLLRSLLRLPWTARRWCARGFQGAGRVSGLTAKFNVIWIAMILQLVRPGTMMPGRLSVDIVEDVQGQQGRVDEQTLARHQTAQTLRLAVPVLHQTQRRQQAGPVTQPRRYQTLRVRRPCRCRP